MDTKKCSKCGVEKALCEFSNDKNKKDGKCCRCKKCVKTYYQANKEKFAEWKKVYREANKEKIRKQAKAYYQANKEKKRAYDRKNRAKRAARVRERKVKDPAYRLSCVVSTSVWVALKNQGTTKGGATFSALPYSPSDLVEHLEKQFNEKMNWENYGDYWEVDHIYPKSLLPYSSLEDENFYKCWALENLQPLEKSANRSKSNKV